MSWDDDYPHDDEFDDEDELEETPYEVPPDLYSVLGAMPEDSNSTLLSRWRQSSAGRATWGPRHVYDAWLILGNPASRSVYDRDRGYHGTRLARRIVARSAFGWIWAFAVGLIAVLTLLGSDNLTRLVGQNLAPDFAEVRVYRADLDDGESNPYTSEFRSSSATWQSRLNNPLYMNVLPAVVLVLAAVLGKRALDFACSRLIVRARDQGHDDASAIRWAWILALGAPLLFFVVTAWYGLGSNDYTTVIP